MSCWRIVDTATDQLGGQRYSCEEDAAIDAGNLNSGWYAQGPSGPWLVVEELDIDVDRDP